MTITLEPFYGIKFRHLSNDNMLITVSDADAEKMTKTLTDLLGEGGISSNRLSRVTGIKHARDLRDGMAWFYDYDQDMIFFRTEIDMITVKLVLS